jgi:pimeloyl-ACP methyl ester carboxylesterase
MQNVLRIRNGAVGLNVVTRGREENEPVILVHGYPDNHRVWNPVAERLARSFYVITYDVRGAGESDIPGRLQARIKTFTSISGPSLDHAAYWARSKLTSRSLTDKVKAFRQLASSWYIGMFHLPLLAPAAWRFGLDSVWPDYLRKQGVPLEVPNPFQKQDGQFGVNLYRANFRSKLLFPEPRYACCPVQLLVPLQDAYVGEQLFDDLGKWVPDLTRHNIDAGHWVILSHPEKVAQLIADFAQRGLKQKSPDHQGQGFQVNEAESLI